MTTITPPRATSPAHIRHLTTNQVNFFARENAIMHHPKGLPWWFVFWDGLKAQAAGGDKHAARIVAEHTAPPSDPIIGHHHW